MTVFKLQPGLLVVLSLHIFCGFYYHQGNEISKVEGLENLKELLELVLDRNKIKALTEFSFIAQRHLQELHMEENRLRSLAHFQCLENMQRLFLGMNRIQVGFIHICILADAHVL